MWGWYVDNKSWQSLFVWAGRRPPWRFQKRWTNRRKREDGGWRRGRQTWLRRFGIAHHPTAEGGGREGGWVIISICPTITDPQLIPTTKEVTMAADSIATPQRRSHNNTAQSSWELPFHMAEAKPLWPPSPCTGSQSKNTKSTTKRFPRTRPAHNNTGTNTSAPLTHSESVLRDVHTLTKTLQNKK